MRKGGQCGVWTAAVQGRVSPTTIVEMLDINVPGDSSGKDGDVPSL